MFDLPIGPFNLPLKYTCKLEDSRKIGLQICVLSFSYIHIAALWLLMVDFSLTGSAAAVSKC